MNPRVDFFFNKAKGWKEELEELRDICLSTGLTEDLKWGCPCYTYEGKNIVLIHSFNDYCALLFFKGALLKDEHRILIQQTENVQLPRQLRFTSLKEIGKRKKIIKAYIGEAVEVEKAGVKMVLKKTTEFTMAEEFKKVLEDMPEVKAAFEALTPGRQRGYLLHFSSAKQAKTREARIEKSIPGIMKGKGLDE